MLEQVTEKSFVGDHKDDIIANISWDLQKPLDQAYLFIDADYNDEKLLQFNDSRIYDILSNMYLEPKTYRFVVNLWNESHDPIDIQFDKPRNSHNSVTVLDVLESINDFLRDGQLKYGNQFVRRDTFIKGIYDRPDKFSRTKGPYFELDYFD